MMYAHLPASPWIRGIPFLIVAALSLWGLVSPRSQWRVLWGWQPRYRNIKDQYARDALVRRSSTVPLLISIVMGPVFVFCIP